MDGKFEVSIIFFGFNVLSLFSFCYLHCLHPCYLFVIRLLQYLCSFFLSPILVNSSFSSSSCLILYFPLLHILFLSSYFISSSFLHIFFNNLRRPSFNIHSFILIFIPLPFFLLFHSFLSHSSLCTLFLFPSLTSITLPSYLHSLHLTPPLSSTLSISYHPLPSIYLPYLYPYPFFPSNFLSPYPLLSHFSSFLLPSATSSSYLPSFLLHNTFSTFPLHYFPSLSLPCYPSTALPYFFHLLLRLYSSYPNTLHIPNITSPFYPLPIFPSLYPLPPSTYHPLYPSHPPPPLNTSPSYPLPTFPSLSSPYLPLPTCRPNPSRTSLRPPEPS